MHMKILVASTNPVKVNACRHAFLRLFTEKNVSVEGLSVNSGVSDQPSTEQETLQGAENRVVALTPHEAQFDYLIGIEGGIEKAFGSIWAFAWVVVSDGKRKGRGRTATFQLPTPVTDLIAGGLELGEANDRVFGQENSKQKGGAIGLLSGNALTRTHLYSDAILMALMPFRRENKILYQE